MENYMKNENILCIIVLSIIVLFTIFILLYNNDNEELCIITFIFFMLFMAIYIKIQQFEVAFLLTIVILTTVYIYPPILLLIRNQIPNHRI